MEEEKLKIEKDVEKEPLKFEYYYALQDFYHNKDYVNFIKTFKEYEKEFDIDSMGSIILYEYARVLQFIKKNNEAAKIFLMIIKRNTKLTSKYYRDLGKLYLDMNRIFDAAECFKKSVYYSKSEEDKQKALYFLGKLYTKRLNYDAAIDVFNKILLIDGENYKALCMLGSIYGSMKQYDMALIYYEKALRDCNLDVRVLSAIGEIYLKQGYLDAATCYIERSIALNMKDGNYYFPSYLSAAELYIKKGNYLKAKEMLNIVFEKSKYRKDIAAAKALLGDISYKKGDLLSALKYYNASIKMDGTLAKSYYKIGDIYIMLNREIDAQNAYNEGNEVETKNIKYFLNFQRELTLTMPNNN